PRPGDFVYERREAGNGGGGVGEACGGRARNVSQASVSDTSVSYRTTDCVTSYGTGADPTASGHLLYRVLSFRRSFVRRFVSTVFRPPRTTCATPDTGWAARSLHA